MEIMSMEISSHRKNDAINESFYSLYHVSGDTQQCVSVERGTCKARLHTIYDTVLKPVDPDDINTTDQLF